ncbi:hypothetical protein PK35_12005 [Tamlana nanhaiensis]|uniref:Uncharacterized protein n=1 Tax=Neotamlana nanhaiensis TaxID=1382798 RepID=A0A0D7VZ36_9FLAO|nr:hypothetical protein [Tamlana nanhaiensis]KJD32150.1 hypothetical protein PK35_11120 [Tamlana nanhaiensis]KJD32312.1 hypothetical protein PK35_12005 [Tamlana nanhaiensis]
MFKQRKPRTFNYQPRFSKENKEKSNESDADKKDFVSKWRSSVGNRKKAKGIMPIRTLILALVLLLICMYLLEKKYM